MHRDDHTPLHTTRIDLHCHSRASDGPAIPALRLIACPESYSEPEQVYDQARARGMDMVTITDHDTIAGALELHSRGFQNFIIGQEVTVYFPEDRCKLHVLVWGLTPDQHEELAQLNLRKDVYKFAAWLRQHNLAHSLAHPLYIQNATLTDWHIQRATLLFKCFETLNGAHTALHQQVLDPYLDTLTPAKILKLINTHNIEPLWPRIWEKGRTAGSDDHGLLNVGRTFTQVHTPAPLTDPRELLKLVMNARSSVAGTGGHSSLLAHQLTTVAAHYCSQRLPKPASPISKLVRSRLLRFAGVHEPEPSKLALAFDWTRRRLARARGTTKPRLPLITAFKHALGPVLAKHPQLIARLDPDAWITGSALSDHDRMAQFADELTKAVSSALASGALDALTKRDRSGLAQHALSYALLQLTQLPYLISLFHQNKERDFLDRFAHAHSSADPHSPTSPLDRHMRVALFTDTLGDVNGVSRFIQNVASMAHATRRDLQVITSTRLPLPSTPNIHNFDPVFATKMPKYEQLEVALPPLLPILRHIDRQQPDVIHISTPGPVGCIGYIAAKMLRVPVLGVYHTDFPAYVDHLFDDHAFTKITQSFMRFFYAPFRSIFTRSSDYIDTLVSLGMPRAKMVPLMPGIDTDAFHTSHADPAVFSRVTTAPKRIKPDSVKVIYVGRVSIEKNLPFLTNIWKRTHAACSARNLHAELIVVGDGPYRRQMQQELANHDAHFLGFRFGKELAALYASSNIFVFPSLTDTLGQVVMEAQACGLPVLVSDKGGPKEVVREGLTGHVLPSTDSAAWIDTLTTLIADRNRCAAMGAAAHTAMQSMTIRHSFEHFWQVHTAAWHEHLASKGITRPAPPAPAPAPTTAPDAAPEPRILPTAASLAEPHTLRRMLDSNITNF